MSCSMALPCVALLKRCTIVDADYSTAVSGAAKRLQSVINRLACGTRREASSPGVHAMPQLRLYHAAPSRSSIAHWMLEELGEPYERQVLSLAKAEHRAHAYLAINPMGKVPALKHGDVVITEAAAICTYLADEFPRAKLNAPIGDPRRGAYLKWLFFSPSCVEPAMMDRAFPRKEEARSTALG